MQITIDSLYRYFTLNWILINILGPYLWYIFFGPELDPNTHLFPGFFIICTILSVVGMLFSLIAFVPLFFIALWLAQHLKTLRNIKFILIIVSFPLFIVAATFAFSDLMKGFISIEVIRGMVIEITCIYWVIGCFSFSLIDINKGYKPARNPEYKIYDDE